MNDKIQDKIGFKLGFVYLMIFLSMVLVGGGISKLFKSEPKILLDPSGKTIMPTSTPTPKTKYGILLMGGGGPGHSGGELSDTMLVSEVDIQKRQITLVNVPRDSWVEIINKQTGNPEQRKVNHAYYLGGGEEAKKWAETITGVDIDYYTWVDFGGFVALVDMLGGLEIDVPTSFVDELYPISGKENEPCGKTEDEIKLVTATLSGTLVDREFMCRYERLEFVQGRVTMDGATTLKFVRSRHAPVGGGDFARAQRQQAVIEAIRRKLLSPAMWVKIPALVNESRKYVATDLKFDEVWKEVLKIGDVNNFTVKRINVNTDNVLTEGYSVDRQYILFPKAGLGKWETVSEYVRSQKIGLLETCRAKFM